MEVSDEVVEFTLLNSKLKISPQGYACDGKQFIIFGASFSPSDYGVQPSKAKKVVSELLLKLTTSKTRITVSEDDDIVMVIAMMPTTDKSLEEDIKLGIHAYCDEVLSTVKPTLEAIDSKK